MSALGSTARPPQSPTPANDGPTTPTPDDYDSVPTPVLSHQQPSRPRSTSPNTLLQRLQKGALEQRRLQQAATMEARPHAPKRPATASNASATSTYNRHPTHASDDIHHQSLLRRASAEPVVAAEDASPLGVDITGTTTPPQ